MQNHTFSDDPTLFGRFDLDNGIPVFYRHYDAYFTQPKLAATVLVSVGGRDDPTGKEGAAHFFEHMPFRGTKNYPSLSLLTQQIENNGGYVNAFTTDEATGYEMILPRSQAKDGIDRMFDMLTSPLLQEGDLALERDIIIEEIKNKRANVHFFARQQLFRQLLGEHPLVHAVIGTEEALKSITGTELQQFHQKYYHAANLSLFIAGSTDIDFLKTMFNSTFGQLTGGEKTERDQFSFSQRPTASKKTLEPTQYNRSVLMSGVALPPLTLSSSIAYKLLRDMLAAGMNSPLHTQIREKRGLAYSLSLQLIPYQDVSLLIFSVATQFQHMPTIEELLWSEMDSIFQNQVRFDEVKNMLLQTLLHREYTVSGLVDEAIDSYLDFGAIIPTKNLLQEIEKVTLESLRVNLLPQLKRSDFSSVWVNCHEETIT